MASTVLPQSGVKQQLDGSVASSSGSVGGSSLPGPNSTSSSGSTQAPTAPLPLPVPLPSAGAGSDSTLATLPSPLVALLLILAGPLRVTKKSIEVLAWRSGSPVESWLVVAGWWAVCLGGRAAYKYILPPLLLLLVPFPSTSSTTSDAPHRSTLSALMASIPFHHTAQSIPSLTASPSASSPRSPASSHTVLLALADLYAIHAMLSAFPVYVGVAGRKGGSTSGGVSAWVWGEGEGQWWAQMERRRLIRGGAVLWAGWVAINWFLGARVTLALGGTALLLLPSPTARAAQRLLAKSLFLRRLATTVFLIVFGSPPVAQPATRFEVDAAAPPSPPFSFRKWIANKWRTSRRPSFALRLRPPAPAIPIADSALADDIGAEGESAAQAALAPCPPVYFRFELQENQRWWMGLDWTSALLPQERPSWCDVYLNPVSPPSSFVLPGESVMYLPVPGREGARTKRTARWRWLDEDWSVVRRTPGGGVGAQGGKDPSAGGDKRHERSGSFSSGHGGDHADVFGSGEHKSTTKGLAEQAFVKGLEKLKARNILGSGGQQGQVGQGNQGGGQGSSGAAPGSPTSSSMASTFAASVGFGTGIMGGAASSSPARNRASMDEPRSRDSSQEDSNRRHSTQTSDVVNPPPGMGAGAGNATLAGHLVNGTTAQGITAAGAGGTTAVAAGLAALMHDLDVQTDNDGWSYGDNKWEGMGPKGGLGRYTRRRRWQRTAICSETVEYIPAPAEIATSGSAATTPKAARRTSVASTAKPAPPVLADTVSPRPEAAGYAVDAPATIIPPSHAGLAGGERKLRTSSASSERDQMLRQRLRNAMGSVGA